ncbi:MAG: HAD family hydrolase [Propionibacteriaceae bacterium]|nr:HAD family hydrolase [Propionibacteriaceae bacterium]
MRPALIATDLDGTFLGARSEPHPGNLAAARRAVAAGAVFVVATGRPRRWLKDLAALSDIDPMVISSNGAATGRLTADRAEFIHIIAPERALEFATALPRKFEVAFAVEYEHTWGREPAYPEGQFSSAELVAPLSVLLEAAPIVKVLARTQHADTHVFSPVALAAAQGHLEATFSWHDACGTVELSAVGVTKGKALAELLSVEGIDPTQCVAFGDMRNDLEMLQLVGRGFIMAGADPCLLGRGFTQIGHHEDGAVGDTILQLLSEA